MTQTYDATAVQIAHNARLALPTIASNNNPLMRVSIAPDLGEIAIVK